MRVPRPVLHVHAAVDGEDVAGDVGGLFGDQELDGVGDVLGLAGAGEGNLGQVLGLHLFGQNARHVGFDVAGGDGVDGDVAATHLLGEGLGHGDEAALGGGVIGLGGASRLPDHGGHIDDPPPTVAHHSGQYLLRATERAGEIDIEDEVPIGRLHAHGQAVAGDAG